MSSPYTTNSPSPKRQLGKKTFGWILIAFAILCFIGGSGFVTRILWLIGFGLPGAWLLLHARRESQGAEPMKKHWGVIAPIAIASLFGAGATTPTPEKPEEPAAVTESTSPAPPSTTARTSTSTSSSTSSATTTPTPSSMVAPSSALETSAPELTPTVEETSEQVMGYTEAPGQTAPTPMEKVIDYCGDPSIHETGTTFFTDGTSGWTQQCADEMAPAVAQQFVAPPANDTPAYTGGGSGRTCAEIGHKVYPGDPDYSLERDKNGDGVGCESYPG